MSRVDYDRLVGVDELAARAGMSAEWVRELAGELAPGSEVPGGWHTASGEYAGCAERDVGWWLARAAAEHEPELAP